MLCERHHKKKKKKNKREKSERREARQAVLCVVRPFGGPQPAVRAPLRQGLPPSDRSASKLRTAVGQVLGFAGTFLGTVVMTG